MSNNTEIGQGEKKNEHEKKPHERVDVGLCRLIIKIMKNDESETVEPVKTRLDRMAMANRIIDTRNMLGMSTYKLCKLLVLDRNSITRLERGEGGCSIETLAGLARVFGCTTDWLLGLSQDGAPTAKK